ncbi:MAG: heavy-metal-associated domain-containing protein [Bacteroidetes bacterium]|nr:heavy-metal-associated domain-containing protein [Bacteroidota bacterium]
MKTLKIHITLMICLFALTVTAQQKQKELPKGVEAIDIQTSAQCEECKERLEKNMAFEKGVKYVDLDLETKVLTLHYKKDKTDPEKLRKAVSKIGYDADDVMADARAYEKLPECCKKGGHDHDHEHEHN